MSKTTTEEYKWQIVDRVKETPDTYTYTFTPVSKSQRFEFAVGEFVTINVLLMRPTASDKLEQSMVQRTYSIASSPTRDLIELTIKDEKPYGYINPVTKKADGFAAYFFEQLKIGDKISIRLNPNKNHFLRKIAAGMEKDIAYWSGANGAESARCLIQYMEDTKDTDINLTLFYSNPTLYVANRQDTEPSLNVIYYEWLIGLAKKMENLRVIFTFTREKEPRISSSSIYSDHPSIVYRTGRFFSNPDGSSERTLLKYHIGNIEKSFNPICGSSGFINGTIRLPDGKIKRGKGIMQNLLEIEGVRPEKIDKEQYYLQQAVG
jgi:ferredoxin-NADP reductase